MTVEEFRKLEDPPGFRLELHHGEVVSLGFPKSKHWKIQQRIRRIFEEALGGQGEAGTEFAFRPEPEHELWGADVAFVAWDRYDAMDEEDNLAGAPDITVEVLSPSNTASEILEKKDVCLKNGCSEFWVVDPKKGHIEITGEKSVIYHSGDSIEVGGKSFTVDDILQGAHSR